jgi:hypothetical protein
MIRFCRPFGAEKTVGIANLGLKPQATCFDPFGAGSPHEGAAKKRCYRSSPTDFFKMLPLTTLKKNNGLGR